MKNNKGFTIVEVMIVLAVAGLILAVVFVAVPALQRNQRNTARKSDVSYLRAQMDTAVSNVNGQQPKQADFLTLLKSEELNWLGLGVDGGSASIFSGSVSTDANADFTTGICNDNTKSTSGTCTGKYASVAIGSGGGALAYGANCVLTTMYGGVTADASNCVDRVWSEGGLLAWITDLPTSSNTHTYGENTLGMYVGFQCGTVGTDDEIGAGEITATGAHRTSVAWVYKPEGTDALLCQDDVN